MRDEPNAYLDLAAVIRKKILTGEWADRLPSVNDLINPAKYDFAVSSRSIAQRALEMVESEGLIERRHGTGNFVILGPARFIDATPEPGATGLKYKVRKVERISPTPDVRAELGIGPGDMAILREQVGRNDHGPVELVSNYYRLDLAEGTAIAEPGPLTGGAKALLETMGHRGVEMVDVALPRMPDKDERATLKLSKGEPVLVVLRTIRDAAGYPIEVSVIVKGGYRYRVRHRIRLS